MERLLIAFNFCLVTGAASVFTMNAKHHANHHNKLTNSKVSVKKHLNEAEFLGKVSLITPL